MGTGIPYYRGAVPLWCLCIDVRRLASSCTTLVVTYIIEWKRLVYTYLHRTFGESAQCVLSVFRWLYANCVSCRLCFLWHHICKLTWVCTLNSDHLELSKSHKLLIILYSMCMSVYCSCVPRVHGCVHSNIVSSPPSPFLPPHLLSSLPFPPFPSPPLILSLPFLPPSLSLTTQWLFWCQL